jgi:hypothetical protein
MTGILLDKDRKRKTKATAIICQHFLPLSKQHGEQKIISIKRRRRAWTIYRNDVFVARITSVEFQFPYLFLKQRKGKERTD